MHPQLPIICKPTPWFLLRGVVVFLMFAVFAVLFFMDGTTGYRKKNETFYLHKGFESAVADFQRMNASGDLTPEAWRNHASRQTVAFPDDASLLPAGLKQPVSWPEILHDYEKLKPMNVNRLWLEYSGQHQLDSKPPEHEYSAWKIREQWIAFWVCGVIALVALFFLLRTLGRKITADENGVITQTGKSVAYGDLRTLDLRKWETKGLAFIDYSGPSGSGKIRLDGLTYGGFRKDNGEPAEQLMQAIRARFSGEVIEYATAGEDPGMERKSSES